MIKREGDPPAATLLLGSDSTPIRAEKALYDLAQWCRERDGLAAYLLDTPSAPAGASSSRTAEVRTGPMRQLARVGSAASRAT